MSIMDWLRIDMRSRKPRLAKLQEKSSFPLGIWFRGEVDGRRVLTPGVFKPLPGRSYLSEAFVNNHLQTKIRELFGVANPFDRLCIAQHYNVPTRLLDWSESLLVAAFFAVARTPYETRQSLMKDGMLYVLNAYRLSKFSAWGEGKGMIHMSTDYGTLFRAELAFAHSLEEWQSRIETYSYFDQDRIPKEDWDRVTRRGSKRSLLALLAHPVPVIPVRTHERMIVQSSTFTIHGGARWNPKTKVVSFPQEDRAHKEIFLACRIPAQCRAGIERELMDLGVHEGTLFPEMEHQRHHLTTIGRRSKNAT